jgi:hypothetical protein
LVSTASRGEAPCADSGVLLVTVDISFRAFMADLEPGDVVLKVDGASVEPRTS